MFIDPSGLEYIVTSGGAYDTNGGYDYEFIEPALKKIKELGELKDGENITWIIANAGWDDADRMKFALALAEVSHSLGHERFTLKMIDNKDQLVDYINNKNGNDRYDDKINKFVVFSHGLSADDGSVDLGYGHSNSGDLKLTKNDINNGIWATAFDNPNSAFYSCNTATSGDTSFAKAWVNKFGGKTWAFVGKSNYENINAGSSLAIKASRFLHGFSYIGSANYPVAGTSTVASGPWQGQTPFMTMLTPK